MDDSGHGNAGENATRQALTGTLARLREELADSVAAYDQLMQQTLPQVKADYATKIGVWETRLLEVSLEAAQAKRRFTLLQQLVNVGEALDGSHLDAVEAQLAGEYREWLQSVEKQQSELTSLLDKRAHAHYLNAADTKKLNKLFRSLARRLHPDLHPGDRQRAEYYRIAQAALANGDLNALESLAVLTASQAEDPDYQTFSNDELAHEIDIIHGRLQAMATRTAELMGVPPLLYRKNLQDPTWIAERTADLKAAIDAYEKRRDHYRRRIAELKKGQL